MLSNTSIGKLLLFSALALLALGGSSYANDAARGTDIIARAIAHHGGDVYTASRSELDVCSRSGCFHVVSRVDGGAFEHDVAGKVEGAERRVRVTNDALEMWVDGAPVEVVAEDLQRRRDWATARVYFCFLPFRLQDPSVLQEDLGLEEWQGRQLHKVKVTFAAGSSTDADDEFLYWFDPETARLEQFVYSFTGRPGGLRFRRLFNYRRVGGILFFDQENLGVDADGLDVDQVDPAFVAERMHEVSVVRLENIAVEPL